MEAKKGSPSPLQVGGFKHCLFSIVYGMSSFPLTFIFFRGIETNKPYVEDALRQEFFLVSSPLKVMLKKNLQGNCNKAIGSHNYHNRTIYSTSRGNSPDGSQDLVVDAFLVRCLFPLS